MAKRLSSDRVGGCTRLPRTPEYSLGLRTVYVRGGGSREEVLWVSSGGIDRIMALSRCCMCFVIASYGSPSCSLPLIVHRAS